MIQSNISRNATIHDLEGSGRYSSSREYEDALRFFPFDVNDRFFKIFGRDAAESKKLFKDAKSGFQAPLFNELKFQRWCFILSSEEGLIAKQTDPSNWADSTFPEITLSISTRFCNINALVYQGSRCYLNSFLINPYLVSQGLGSKTYQYFESFIATKYQVKQFCLQPLTRDRRDDRPAEDAGVFWKKMGFKYPNGADVLKLNPLNRKDEPAERVQISQNELNILNNKHSGQAPHGIEIDANNNKRIWVAQDMWKDVSTNSNSNLLPEEFRKEMDLRNLTSNSQQPKMYFDFDDASPSKLSRKTVDQLSYDRTNNDSLISLLRRSYIALCNPIVAQGRKKKSQLPQPVISGRRARTPTVRFAAQPRNVRQKTNPQPIIKPVFVPVKPPPVQPTVIPPQQIAATPPAAVLAAPQNQLTRDELDERQQWFNDYLNKPLTQDEKDRKEQAKLFNSFINKPNP